MQEELLNELKIMHGIKCEFIIRLIGLCYEEDTAMLVMEYAHDGPLSSYLQLHKLVFICVFKETTLCQVMLYYNVI